MTWQDAHADTFTSTANAASAQTRYADLQIDAKGRVTSLVARQSGKEYIPAGRPSAILCLHENNQPDDQLLEPVSAVFHADKDEFELKYPNGSVARVKAEAKDTYFRFQLVSLEPRGEVDIVVWGPLKTTVSKIIGDLIGVVRDDDWAIGMVGLDDNTIAGPITDGDSYGMGYYIHSPDPEKYPLPPELKEGQWFNIGGDGRNDVAFYSRPEEYFQMVFGTGARLEPEYGSSVAYHARDRRKAYTHFYSLLPGFEPFRRRHVVSDPIPGVDFIGSGIALYACPDDLGLDTIEKITLAENLPHIVIDEKWIRDPAAFQPKLYWNGPCDKLLAYAELLGLRDIARDTAEFYPSLENRWVGRVGFSDGRTMTYREFAEEAAKHGKTHGGLHTLCLFLQGGISSDVTPVPSERLQTVCRTKLAKDVSATDMEIVVTDPSFLAEKGTWQQGDDSNYLRINGEMLRYEGISSEAPWTIRVSKRGHASQAAAHKAGDELVKLQQNCYNGFIPDMTLSPLYADYYAKLMHENGMTTLDFDGLEGILHQHHGSYAMRVFFRRFFDTYAALSGGKYPRITASCVFSGAWEYMDVCDVGGGNRLFDPVGNRWGTQGKDIRNGFSASYFPPTFGKQGWNPGWSVYDAQNLQAKAVGWDATYSLVASQSAIEQTGEKDEIIRAYRTWQNARSADVFTKQQKLQLRDGDHKFHLVQTGEKAFLLYPVKEVVLSGAAGNTAKEWPVANPHAAQPMQFALRVADAAEGCVVTLPGGVSIRCDRKIEPGQYIVCKGRTAYLASNLREKIADLSLESEATLPAGESTIGVRFPGRDDGSPARFSLTQWIFGEGEEIGN